jgi:hypothetical protein
MKKYTKLEIESLTPLAEEMVKELNFDLARNLEDVYQNIHRYLLDDKGATIKRCEKEAKAFRKSNTLESMVKYIKEWGEDNDVPIEELRETFKDEVDWEVFGLPGEDWPMGY